MSWPDGGPWIVTTTSTAASWTLATAVLGAAATVRVAVLRIVAPDEDHADDQEPRYTGGLASHLEVRAGGSRPLTVDDVVGIVRSLAGGHGLVLVGATPGLLVPLGADGWTLADLAWALGAPVVVVTDSGPDSTNHTTLILDALANRELPATVVAIGEGNTFDTLPVALAGRIPAEAVQRPELVGTQAVRWLDPLLHAGPDRPRVAADADRPGAADTTRPGTSGAAEPATPGADTPDTADVDGTTPSTDVGDGTTPSADVDGTTAPVVVEPAPTKVASPAPTVSGGTVRPRTAGTVSGKRVLVVLLGIFLALVLVLCGITVNGLGEEDTSLTQISVGPREVGPDRPVVERASAYAVPVTPPGLPRPVRPSGGTVCPQHAGTVKPTSPNRRTTARVNAAWQRIERWLADHAPRSRASLRPPAPAKQIDAVQVRMSVAFPPDLVASLRRHDGTTPGGLRLTFLYRLMPLQEIVRSWEVSCTVLADSPTDDDWWHRSFVPFAEAGDGGALLVDQRSGGHGRVGEFYPEDGTRFDGWPPSVADLLEGVARSLENGEPYLGRFRPVVTGDGVLEWEVVVPPTTGAPR
ncbi:SMI1/KNR4 family protein [Plantactinospora sonchi]|uniref:SMI1/KNR4 family protein n=1 Tax=Plantactinospora sonchi TaxID=1544735 RepID=A0ABU7RXG6_9ACTN